MSKNKKILMVMPVMKGGGAERVASLLLNEFHKNGYDCEFLLTSSTKEESVIRDLNCEIPITSLSHNSGKLQKLLYSILRILSSIFCKPFELFSIPVPSLFAYISFVSHYYSEINELKTKLKQEPESTIISFLQPSVPITLIAAKNLPNRVIISERGNPKRLLKKRYGYNFIKKYYQRADAVVFQTPNALNAYPENISEKGTVIFNPINNNLPESYFGEREKFVTTFCRISPEKNLIMLADAFAEFYKENKDYRLKIIGDAVNDSDKKTLIQLKDRIHSLGISDVTDILPFSPNVHPLVLHDAMYVNSSDYEGMSNAMLEAMAIGMPVICTDCPIGGASAVIDNGENGILTEVGNAKELADAMKKIASDKDFSDKLSRNAAQIREKLSLENTAKKWMELL